MDKRRCALTEYYAAKRQSLVEEATRLLHGDRMTAEDMVQTTFLRLLQAGVDSARLRAIDSQALNALVHTTMFNLLRDLWRHRHHEQTYEHLIATASSRASHADEVFSVCSAQQITELLEHRMARMDDGVARVLRMNVIEGKAVKEIAKELDMKYKTAENRLQTGRKQLREYMRKVV